MSGGFRFGPHVRELRGHEPETWRFRIGSWRFFYEVADDERVVVMTAASHRSSAYRSGSNTRGLVVDASVPLVYTV